MSRKLFAFLLSELKTVRVICPTCKSACELSIENLAKGTNRIMCPGCGKDLIPTATIAGTSPTLATLAEAIRFLQNNKTELEFVLPDPSE